MKTINSDMISLSILDNDEEIDISNIRDGFINYFIHSGNIFKSKSVAGIKYISPSPEDREILEENFPEVFKSTYESDTTYYFDTKFTKIPNHIFKDVLAFLKCAYEKHKCESMCYLLFNEEKSDWKIIIPIQYNLSRTSVSYLSFNRINNDTIKKITSIDGIKDIYELTIKEYNSLFDDGYVISGTVHSHSNFSAFHSSVDDNDEMNFDGIHITVGDLDKTFSYSARYCFNGSFVDVDMKEIIENFRINISPSNKDMSNLLNRLVTQPIQSNKATNLLSNQNKYWQPKTSDSDDYFKWMHGIADFRNSESKEQYEYDDDDEDICDLLIDQSSAVVVCDWTTGDQFYIDRDNYMIYKDELERKNIFLERK